MAHRGERTRLAPHGFVLYVSTYAGAGALARRQEDVPTISIPITMLIAAGYYLASVLALDQPRSTVFQVLSLLPPFSPFLMPTRLAVGDLMWWEQPLAFVLSLLAVLMTLRLSGRLYRRSILGFQQPASSPEPRHRRPRTPNLPSPDSPHSAPPERSGREAIQQGTSTLLERRKAGSDDPRWIVAFLFGP